MVDTTGNPVPMLEALVVRAGLTCSAGELAEHLGVDAGVLRHLFDRSANARDAARQASADEALELLAKLGQKAARAMKREAKRAEAAAEAEARAADPLAQELDGLFGGLDDGLGVLDDMDFAWDEEARALGLPWAPPPPGYRHPRYVKPPPAPRCGAKTRKGEPCIRGPLPNGRCRNHGGLSTGFKTQEGKLRSIEASRRYQAQRRARKPPPNANARGRASWGECQLPR